ncbi:uncharacterized protein LOC9641832 [Selaginella moellendorffii]|uniref:uncharacterized protein LOC9641832 n=1 Tax=Selaginella moellendorffii TaxID=88036 RepID=UPI000D1CA02F|nr:uncharacterized protein LOC9641832 [Selaginella moellendorffii]|eukprot:XP_024531724.1 uncharacterized protein LOC9641832 [Selaginella moellendorffii]
MARAGHSVRRNQSKKGRLPAVICFDFAENASNPQPAPSPQLVELEKALAAAIDKVKRKTISKKNPQRSSGSIQKLLLFFFPWFSILALLVRRKLSFACLDRARRARSSKRGQAIRRHTRDAPEYQSRRGVEGTAVETRDGKASRFEKIERKTPYTLLSPIQDDEHQSSGSGEGLLLAVNKFLSAKEAHHHHHHHHH